MVDYRAFDSTPWSHMKVRTRFAPSPTGFLHVGGARTALFCWLFARRHGGTYVLRIEDTDRERSTQASVDAILDSLAWLGLEPDEGPYYQTERFDRYREHIDNLLSAGNAYHCYCSREELDAMREQQRAAGEKPRYDGRCRNRSSPRDGVEPVVRFKNPTDGDVVVNDLIRGEMSFANQELDDLIIARPDGTPTYNFTVVVDDLEMDITHVIRGDDHINNTPRQMNIFEALGGELPAYAHVPMILGADGQRLSKRHGAVGVMQFKDDGYLPEALLNYLVRLGWSHGDQEIFSREQMIELFDLSAVNKAPSAFDFEKLQWLNQHYIKARTPAELTTPLSEQLALLDVSVDQNIDLTPIISAQHERAKTLREMAENSVYFFEDFEVYEEKAASKNLKAAALAPLCSLRQRLEGIEDWTAEPIHDVVVATAEAAELKLGKVAQPLRVAVSGRSFSPPIDITLEIVGKTRTLSRLDQAIDYIKMRE